jgi:hypothetical protein
MVAYPYYPNEQYGMIYYLPVSGPISTLPRYVHCPDTFMDTVKRPTGQDKASVVKNAKYFDANERYANKVGALDTYRNIRSAIGPEIAGSEILLDVGNGGVFDYDTSLAKRIVGVDLCFDGDNPLQLDEHITLRWGDALALDEPDAAYDRVLEVSVFHHLIGNDVDSTFANIGRAIEEAHRVLALGGRLVVMESCISERAFMIERRLFGALRRLAQTPLMGHPATLQFPPQAIARAIRDRFGNVTVASIPLGRWVIQFGVRMPSALTPVRAYMFTATRC